MARATKNSLPSAVSLEVLRVAGLFPVLQVCEVIDEALVIKDLLLCQDCMKGDVGWAEEAVRFARAAW